jgi:cytochrome c
MKNSMLAAALVAVFAMYGQARADEVAKGKEIFDRTCSNCHSTQIGVNKVGPSLWAVVGRPVAGIPDFSYSAALIAKRDDWKAWDEQRIDDYLVNPREVLHGVKMYFKGLPEEKDRQAVIAYLKTLTWPDL